MWHHVHLSHQKYNSLLTNVFKQQAQQYWPFVRKTIGGCGLQRALICEGGQWVGGPGVKGSGVGGFWRKMGRGEGEMGGGGGKKNRNFGRGYLKKIGEERGWG